MQVHSSLALLCTLMAAVVALTACYPTVTSDVVRIMARTAVGRIKKIKDEVHLHKSQTHAVLRRWDSDILIEALI